MKVKVSLTLDVDDDAWREQFGCDPGEVAGDVRNYVVYQIVTMLDEQDLLLTDEKERV